MWASQREHPTPTRAMRSIAENPGHRLRMLEELALDTGQILDTGQKKTKKLDTGQKLLANQRVPFVVTDESLAIAHHEIHRVDEPDELIISTLKYFQLHCEVQSMAGDLLYHLDGVTLVADLLYEDGNKVEDLSVTFEPPLLGDGGACPPKALIEGGCASFKLRITVLSSLCQKRLFRVRITSEERPGLCVLSDAVKTITKLRRSVRDPRAATLGQSRRESLGELSALQPSVGKRALTQVADEFTCSLHEVSESCDVTRITFECTGDGEPTDVGAYSIDELWEQVATNGSRLLELQVQQRRLFKELRTLRAACGM